MKILWKLFAVAFVYSLLEEMLFSIGLGSLANSFPQSVFVISQLAPFLSLTIVIEFGIFYIVGKKHELKKSLFPSIVSIYVGAVIGLIIETLLAIIITPYIGGSVAIDGWFLAYSFTLSLVGALSILFTAIAGIAVANIRHGTQ